MIRTSVFHIFMLAISCASSYTWASERREWVHLIDCRYVAEKYNDGDSFHVKCGTQEFVARFYFVDALESNLRYADRTREQSEYFGVTLDDALRAGRQATDLAQSNLQRPFSIWTRWASAGGRTKLPRFYSIVETGGHDLAELLVGAGLARTKGVNAAGPTGKSSHEVQEHLRAVERDAQQHKRGVWATSTLRPVRDDRQ